MRFQTNNWRPTASLAVLEKRAALLEKTRQFFRQRGFLEVETPLLSAETVIDRHIEAPYVESQQLGLPPGKRFWLQTSPEAAMKRLLAAGATAVFQITHAFRAGEAGRLHNPEFTIVEWYRCGDDMQAGIDLLDQYCSHMLECAPAERLSYRQVFERYTTLNPHECSGEQLLACARNNRISLPESLHPDDRSTLLEILFTELVQPHLGHGCPTIVYDFPACQAALARIRRDAYPVAERFELFVNSIELANGYHELTDPEELRHRFEQTNVQRSKDGNQQIPLPEKLLDAMRAGLPSSAGCALGFDRLVMLAVGARSIAEVIAFPINIA